MDWKGELYCGITLDWNCEQRFVDLSMSNSIKKVLELYRHNAPRRKQDCAYQPAPRQYGPQSQILPKEDPGTPWTMQGNNTSGR